MIEKGIIADVQNHKLIINIIPSNESCKSCRLSGSCSGKSNNVNQLKLNCKESDQYRVGDRITLEIGEQKTVLFSILIFLVPIVLFLSGFILLGKFFTEVIQGIGSVLITGVYFYLLIKLQRLFEKDIAIKKLVKSNHQS